MQVIAGLSLKNLKPRVWDPESPHYLPGLRAVMVSYAEFHAMPWLRERAMKIGLRKFLGAPAGVSAYLDNGAFCFFRQGGKMPEEDYKEFVRRARPDWYPIPRERIPAPMMSSQRQTACRMATMESNLRHNADGFVPVAHVGPFLGKYTEGLKADAGTRNKRRVALGGIVPNLLRAPKALPYPQVLNCLFQFRGDFPKGEKDLHIFGIGGTATVHLAALVGLDSADSSGWRNRAARGIVQLLGKGDRIAADLGGWRGRVLTPRDKKELKSCECPACAKDGWRGMTRPRMEGFCHRAVHNLWILLQEAEWADAKIRSGEYADEYESRLDNSTYLPLVRSALAMREERARKRRRRVGN